LLAALGAIWTTWEYKEWLLTPGRMVLRRRFGRWIARERAFERASLGIERRTDSDGDDHYALVVRDPSRRRVLSRAIHDPYELEHLAEWVAAPTGFPFKPLCIE